MKNKVYYVMHIYIHDSFNLNYYIYLLQIILNKISFVEWITFGEIYTIVIAMQMFKRGST
jgi:hypothetical protein